MCRYTDNSMQAVQTDKLDLTNVFCDDEGRLPLEDAKRLVLKNLRILEVFLGETLNLKPNPGLGGRLHEQQGRLPKHHHRPGAGHPAPAGAQAAAAAGTPSLGQGGGRPR